jgi:hypothetical protein
MLVGSFGSKVTLKFKRISDKKKVHTYKLTLTRGKKATFHDTTDTPAKAQDSQRKIIVAVPDGLRPGDIMNCEDEDGSITRVGSPP